jgi:hypothetical protein
MTRDVDLHVDALIVDGLSYADGVRVGDAFARELVRLLEVPGASQIPMQSQAIDRLDAGAIPNRTQHPTTLGTAVARAVHRGLVR